MANLNKETAEHAQSFTGAFGNQSVRIFKYTAAAAQIGDIIYLGKLPKYAKVYALKLVNAALGAGSTLSIGYTTAEIGGTLTADDNYWLSAQATENAATTAAIASAVPVTLAEETFVIATLAGGAATGDFYVVVEYIYESD